MTTQTAIAEPISLSPTMRARREQMLNAIWDYLAEVGLAEFSYRGAARAAGVTPKTLGNHFSNKEGLLDTLLERGFRNQLDRANYHGDSHTAADLIKYLKSHASNENGPLYEIEGFGVWLQLASLASGPNASPHMRERMQLTLEILREDFISGLVQIGLPRKKAGELGTHILSMIRGVERDYRIHRDKKRAKKSYLFVIKIFEQELELLGV